MNIQLSVAHIDAIRQAAIDTFTDTNWLLTSAISLLAMLEEGDKIYVRDTYPTTAEIIRTMID